MINKIKYTVLGSVLAFMPIVAGAQVTTGGTVQPFDTGDTLKNYLAAILTFINDVLIPLILGVAFLLFVWGMFQYFIAGGANEEAREKGKSLLIYAILGFVVIVVFWGIINLLSGVTGLSGGSAPVIQQGIQVR